MTSAGKSIGMRALAVLAGVFVLACLLGYMVIRHAVNATIERQALTVAEIVASQATTARSVYTREIAGKLASEGLGPHVDSASMPGHVPLPAQFLKLVGRASSENSDRLYEYKPVSRWNLEPTQGLTDDFLRWAWPQLEAQDQVVPGERVEWRSVSRIETQDGRRVLRLLSADPASQPSCATCHNSYEQRPEVIARRVADGVPTGKQWRQHQLLGALAVTIPLDKAEALAGSQINETTIFIAAILVGSFAAMAWFSWRLSRQERSLRETELQLRHSEREARTVNALLKTKQEMLRVASHDALTGLVNRALLRDRVQQALESDRRTGALAAVLFIDLDQFKAVNDSLGHETGDRLLAEVARRLVASVRSEDTVARQGGDEFIVFMPRIGEAASAGLMAEKLLAQLARPFVIDGRELYLGSSIGIAVFPEHGNDVDALLKNSDTAMYQVKDAGRNHYAFFTPQMNERGVDRYGLVSELRRAAERHEFLLHYQPILGVASGAVQALEVLLRWQHPTRGLVSPAEFIPLAESSGLIVPIGEWVLREACRQIKAWQAQGLEPPRLAINLSPIQVHHRSLVERFTAILREMDVPPQALELEITEGSLMNKTADVMATLHQLSALGLRLAIDDFGTGYSSLSYLKRLPIDTLKIDRSFVCDIGDDPDDTTIVSAIISMARSLQLEVIAEGVETARQLAFLREQGCDQFQGFLVSRPLPAAEVASLLGQRHLAVEPM